jgi:hypothetical protein
VDIVVADRQSRLPLTSHLAKLVQESGRER